MTVTEDRIIASVYCNSNQCLVQPSSTENPPLKSELQAFHGVFSDPETEKSTNFGAAISSQPQQSRACKSVLLGFGKHKSFYRNSDEEEEEDKLIAITRNIFGIEENRLLLKGEDDTLRLRQLHDQIMVLRGATFNGVITFSLCLFAWGMKAKRRNSRKLHVVLAALPALFLLLALQALHHHLFVDREFANPPYMEFSLLAIGATGAYALWLPRSSTVAPELAGAVTGDSGEQVEEQDCILRWKWGRLSCLFAILFVAGLLGWWATEVLYGQRVIYSYDSQLTTKQLISNDKQATGAGE